MKNLTEKKQPKKAGLRVTHSAKSEKVNDYVYVLSNGQELRFKDKEFPTIQPTTKSDGQLLMFNYEKNTQESRKHNSTNICNIYCTVFNICPLGVYRTNTPVRNISHSLPI